MDVILLAVEFEISAKASVPGAGAASQVEGRSSL
jgi:hypothetical protein